MLGLGTLNKLGAGAAKGLSTYFFAPLTTSLTASGKGDTPPTFTRANATATVVDQDSIIRHTLANEARFYGARRVENLVTGNSDTTLPATTTVVVGQDYRVSFEGTGTVGLTGAVTDSLAGTTGERSAMDVFTASTTTLTHSVTSGTCSNFQIEDVTGQSNQSPAEYVGIVRVPFADRTPDEVGAGWEDNGDNTYTATNAIVSKVEWAYLTGLDIGTSVDYEVILTGHSGQNLSLIIGGGGAAVLMTGDGTYTGTKVIDTADGDIRLLAGFGSYGTVEIVSITTTEGDHGANVPRVKYFDTPNWNTVDNNNLVVGTQDGGDEAVVSVLAGEGTGYQRFTGEGTCTPIIKIGGYDVRSILTGIDPTLYTPLVRIVIDNPPDTPTELYPKDLFESVTIRGVTYLTADSETVINSQDDATAWLWRPDLTIPEYMDIAMEDEETYDITFNGFTAPTQLAEATLRGRISESERENLCFHSEDMSDAVWTGTATHEATASGVAPDGTTTAFHCEQATATSDSLYQSDIVLAAETNYVLSVFVKNVDATASSVVVYDADASATLVSATAIWVDGVPSIFANGTVEDYGNGWYRIIMPFTTTASGASNKYEPRIVPESFAVATQGCYVWGWQVEEGSHASMYIKTEAIAVTRSKDTLTYPVADNLQSQDVSIEFKWTPLSDDIGTTSLAGSFVDSNNYWEITYDGTDLDFIRKTGGSTDTATASAISFSAGTAYAVKATNTTADGMRIWFDGTEGTPDATVAVLSGGTNFSVGTDGSGDGATSSCIKNFTISEA